jgi:lipopolysaccharide transport system ATP-binding protein
MSAAAVITAEGLGKYYRIGVKEQMSENLAGAAIDFVKSPLRNFRKYRSLYRFDDLQAGRESADIFWALRDVSFEVKEGEVLGIIGRNGAGKSTLLKILSRITDPSTGQAQIRGRVSSLLEVGTGFHPELSGRENVYLNAAILGMKKREIDRKFDEIVDFSGVEKFIDTPVKRYSSGMKVRLAFSVAAHLDPEVLVIDEVLAVGDAAFQSKCLGKMNTMAGGGRTVLFVSHNMAAMANLCTRAILLQHGRVTREGSTEAVIGDYLSGLRALTATDLAQRSDRRGTGGVRIEQIELLDGGGRQVECAVTGQDLTVRFHYQVLMGEVLRNCRISLAIFKDERPYLNLSTELVDARPLELTGSGHIDFTVDQLPLSEGQYSITCFAEAAQVIQDWVHHAALLPVVDGDFYGTGRNYPPGWKGETVLIPFRWRQGRTNLQPVRDILSSPEVAGRRNVGG